MNYGAWAAYDSVHTGGCFGLCQRRRVVLEHRAGSHPGVPRTLASATRGMPFLGGPDAMAQADTSPGSIAPPLARSRRPCRRGTHLAS